MAELILAELAGEKAARLVTKLCDALVDQRLVDRVVSIHGGYFSCRAGGGLITAAYDLITASYLGRAASSDPNATQVPVTGRRCWQNVIRLAEWIRGYVQHPLSQQRVATA